MKAKIDVTHYKNRCPTRVQEIDIPQNQKDDPHRSSFFCYLILMSSEVDERNFYPLILSSQVKWDFTSHTILVYTIERRDGYECHDRQYIFWEETFG